MNCLLTCKNSRGRLGGCLGVGARPERRFRRFRSDFGSSQLSELGEMSILKYMVLLHKDVPRAAQFYAHGLGLAVNVCTTRWAELQSGPCKIALMEAPSNVELSKGYSPFLSFNVTDMDGTVLRLLSMGAELDGPIKHPPQGKVAAMRGLDGHLLGLFEPNQPE